MVFEKLSTSYKKNVMAWINTNKFVNTNNNNLDWVVEQKNDIIKHINTKTSQGTIRNNILTINKILRLKKLDIDEDIRQKAESIFEKIKEKQGDQKVNNKVADNYVTYKVLIKKRNQLKRIFNKTKNINIMYNYLILSLYTFIPPLRNDYSELEITNNKPSGKENKNILWNNKNKFVFYLNNDKVVKHMGKAVYKFPNSLNKVIKSTLDVYPRKYLFSKIDNKDLPIKSHVLLRMINDIFINENKKVGIRILRSIYITNYIDTKKRSKNQLLKLAKTMRHSLQTQTMSYNKILTDKQIENSKIKRLKKILL